MCGRVRGLVPACGAGKCESSVCEVQRIWALSGTGFWVGQETPKFQLAGGTALSHKPRRGMVGWGRVWGRGQSEFSLCMCRVKVSFWLSKREASPPVGLKIERLRASEGPNVMICLLLK